MFNLHQRLPVLFFRVLYDMNIRRCGAIIRHITPIVFFEPGSAVLYSLAMSAISPTPARRLNRPNPSPCYCPRSAAPKSTRHASKKNILRCERRRRLGVLYAHRNTTHTCHCGKQNESPHLIVPRRIRNAIRNVIVAGCVSFAPDVLCFDKAKGTRPT